MNASCNSCYRRAETFLAKGFGKYGRLVARYPWVFIISSVVVSGCLGFGLIRVDPESDIETAYTPKNSQASKDRAYIYRTYPDFSVSNFSVQNLPDLGLYADIIVKSKQGSDILSSSNLDYLQSMVGSIANITVRNGTASLGYSELCARRDTQCAMTGSFVFTSSFKNDLTNDLVNYPMYEHASYGTTFLPFVLGDVDLNGNNVSSAQYLRIRLHLRQDGGNAELSEKWLESFQIYMGALTSITFDFAYAHSSSLGEELDKNTQGDIVYISLTFTLMICYAIFAIFGGNCVSNRGFLANAGVLATGLAILGAIGLMSACGVKFVTIVAVMPFLVLGIGVDDMFILLSGLAEAQNLPTVEERIAETMKSAGLAITITSVTDLLAFCVGSVSVFLSVQNFCIYTGVAVIFCYLNQVTFFTGCMALHEKRVLDSRHGSTCKITQSKEEMETNHESKLKIVCCSGSPPKSREDVEGILERYPRKFLSFILQYTFVRIIILLLFAVYVSFAIWGATQTEEGLLLQDTVSETSYYYKYETFLSHLSSDHFVSFIFKDDVQYWDASVRRQIDDLIISAQSLQTVRENFKSSWIDDFVSSPFFDDSSKNAFVIALQSFLDVSTRHVNDVVITNNKIISSRVHFLTENMSTTNIQADLMLDLREVADKAPVPVIAYAPPFIFYEQYTAILPSTLQTVGIALAAVVVATFLFMPHVIMMCYVIVTLVMIVVGVFGFMYFWGITLSSITMILLIMSVGFAIDYSIHSSHAFIQSKKSTRLEKMTVAVNMAAAPIVNAALSSFIGILMLLFSSSYIFQTFFKIMLLVIILGFVHSTFFLPALLSFVGPLDAHLNSGEIKFEQRSGDTVKTESRASVSPHLSPRNNSSVSLELKSNSSRNEAFHIPRPTVTGNGDGSR